MVKNLVIVESPAKAKTIEGYLGKDFVVKSSYGHVRDLPKGNNSIDIKNGYKPRYEISDDKKQVVSELKKLAKDAETVWLATDDDREGEAISWHLKEALGLKDQNTRRIVFREITKPAILRAIEQPRTINYDLVNAQQARRVLDRLVGFEISPILWKKIRTGLSAGRVQSVAVRMIVEREREIEAFNTQSYFKVTAQFSVGGKTLNAELAKNIPSEAEARAFVEKVAGAEFSVKNLEVKPAKRSPAPPFTTSTLQQEASRKLGFSVSQTMVLAQRLYEAGHISYMRTDSVNLSETAINGAKAEIEKAYGAQFVKVRHFKTKNESAQEAHEAIRPTNFGAHSLGKDRDEKRLYELIWRRAIASQMAEAELERTLVSIAISTAPETLSATGEVIKFEGFLKVYIESTDTDEEEEEDEAGLLPPLTVGQVLNLAQLKARQRYTQPPSRYTEASLVKKLEEMGIGRPSTYAPTISTIVAREYVVKEWREGKPRPYKELILNAQRQISQAEKSEITGAEKGKLFPTDIGIIVNDFLVMQFPDVVDFHFTAEIEEKFDHIAHGSMDWSDMIDGFYQPFHTKVEAGELIERSAVGMSRELGIHPQTGQKVIARLARYGPIVQIGETDGDTKPQYANLRKDQRLETISLEEALELFKLPRTVGEYQGKTLVAADGRFGPYVRHDGKFYSIPKGEDPLSISEERAIELILAKQEAEANRLIKAFAEREDVKVLNGRWGPYVAYGDQNIKIPKGLEPAELTLEKIDELALAQADAPKRSARGRAGAKTAPKTATKAATKTAAKPAAKAAPKTKAAPKSPKSKGK